VQKDTFEGTLRLLEDWLRTTPEEREKMSVNALSCFRMHYDMGENAKALIQIFVEVAREKAN